MQQYVNGNQFQIQVCTKFNMNINSAMANMSCVRGKEDLVYEYIREIGTLFQPPQYNLKDGNPVGFYSDYDSFKKHFVRYWKNALNISKEDLNDLKDIYDEEVSSQESCRNTGAMSVFFENGEALTIDDCLNNGAMYFEDELRAVILNEFSGKNTCKSCIDVVWYE